MTLKSMTGFGRGESAGKNRQWTVEVRCVNNRFLDPKIKLPRDYAPFEEKIRKMIGDFHQRGRVDLNISVNGDFSDLVNIRVDRELASAYKSSLESMGQDLGIECKLDAVTLAAYPEVIVREQKQEDLGTIQPYVEEAVTRALENCLQMREQEGRVLKEDLQGRLRHFTEICTAVEKRIPDILKDRQKSLQERLDKLLDTTGIDPMRLAQEVAILADKTDVTEELVRIKSHVNQFEEIIGSSNEAVGRTLDFLIQEFLREVNTIASKINDADTAHKTVELKSELEKMREQVQNIE
jgi:uncharacterized protein (TIGR00255 family)